MAAITLPGLWRLFRALGVSTGQDRLWLALISLARNSLR